MPAQTQTPVAHLAVQSGNGQVACICNSATLQNLQEISVKATDNNGNPVQGATVTWTVTSGEVLLAPVPNTPPVNTTTNTTDGEGIARMPLSLIIFNNFSSTAVLDLISTIQASAGNNSVTFTETQSLIDQSTAASVISAASPTFNGVNLIDATLSAPVGATLTTPIIVDVGGLDTASNGVPNVSVRILNEQASPQLSCAPAGGYADPGSVLSNAQGVATCYPVFTGSGTGTFYILIGGVPGTDISTALDLQAFPGANQPGYPFTSIPGAPASVEIVSGNNQVAPFEVPLNPLVARLVDANGNAVQGQQMVWSVVPAGAVGFTSINNVTDNNGEVTQTVSLYSPAAAGATITVALQSNPNIAATFQETVQGALTAMNKVNGNNQSAQVGTAFAIPLVVQVLNASGPVVNYPVQYIVSGPLSIPFTTVGTNSLGEASLTVTAGSLVGTGTVTAIAGALTQVFNLTVTAVSNAPPPNGLTIVSGNAQSATINAPFGAPLVVQVNSTAGPVANYTVNLTTTGSVALSSSSATTGANGQATINVTAGSTPGAGTVTASVTGGYTVTFNLTVNGIGPTLTAASFLNAASGVATQSSTPQLSPCSLATISASGLTPDNGIADVTAGPIFGRFPKSVNNLTVTFGGVPAPILRVQQSATNPQVTVQVPCEVTPGNSVPVVVNVNGGGTATVNIPIAEVSPGIFTQVMSDGVSRAVATRADGSFADVGGADTYDPSNPVRLNEDVRFYVTGMGVTTPAIGTDAIQNPNADLAGVNAVVAGGVVAGIVNGPTLQVISARPAPDLVGVYEIQVMIPNNAPTGNSVSLYIGIIPVGSSATFYAPNVLVPIGQ